MAKKTVSGLGAICGVLVILWAIFPNEVNNYLTMFGKFMVNYFQYNLNQK